VDGLLAVVEQFDGFELPARAWERAVLPARVERYEPSMLDMLTLTGQLGWARLSPPDTSARLQAGRVLRVALFPRHHGDAWRSLIPDAAAQHVDRSVNLDRTCLHVLDQLRARGACFAADVGRACDLDKHAVAWALATLATRGLVTSDGFAGVRVTIRALAQTVSAFERPHDAVGRWSLIEGEAPPAADAPAMRDAALDAQACALLQRYGIVFRRLLARETTAVSWRELSKTYRRLEARGEIRGGRFVTGVSGEQFALPDAVARLREIRRSDPDPRPITISAADPLNLTGILTSGERVRAVTSSRIAYRNGVAMAAVEGSRVRPLANLDTQSLDEAAAALSGRSPAARI
jgi:ATP-dependent Lhr-like helicase